MLTSPYVVCPVIHDPAVNDPSLFVVSCCFVLNCSPRAFASQLFRHDQPMRTRYYGRRSPRALVLRDRCRFEVRRQLRLAHARTNERATPVLLEPTIQSYGTTGTKTCLRLTRSGFSFPASSHPDAAVELRLATALRRGPSSRPPRLPRCPALRDILPLRDSYATTLARELYAPLAPSAQLTATPRWGLVSPLSAQTSKRTRNWAGGFASSVGPATRAHPFVRMAMYAPESHATGQGGVTALGQ